MGKTTYTAEWDDSFGYGRRRTNVTTQVELWQRKASLYDELAASYPNIVVDDPQAGAKSIERSAMIDLVNKYGGLIMVRKVLQAVFDNAAVGDEHRGFMVRRAIEKATDEINDAELDRNR